MHRKSTLDALFPTVRGGVLSATLLQPNRWWFMTELARHLGTTPSSLQRELQSLVSAGLLMRRQDGRRAYFKANTDSPLFHDLRRIIEKTAGLLPAIQAAFKNFGDGIVLALAYGSVARGEEHSASDVDLIVVGKVKHVDLLAVLRRLEKRFHREVNVALFSAEEFRRRLAAEDHFLHSVLKSKTILLKGAPNELEDIASGQQGLPAQDRRAGAD